MSKIKNILIGGIASITLGALPLLLNINGQYQKVEATAINMSTYTKVTSLNMEDELKEGAQVYLVAKDNSMGIGTNQTNYRANTKETLSPINAIVDENGLALYSEYQNKYITLATGSVVKFDSSIRTYVNLTTEGKITYGSTYYLGYKASPRHIGFATDSEIADSDYFYMYVCKDEELSDVNRYAYHLLNDLSCDSTGVSAPSSVSWKNIQSTYYTSSIGEEIKDMSGDEDSPISIERALAKYDYVIGKYKDRESYPHYITGRAEPSLLHNSDGYTDVVTFSKDNTAAIIVTISAAILSATVVSYFVIRKKKQD